MAMRKQVHVSKDARNAGFPPEVVDKMRPWAEMYHGGSIAAVVRVLCMEQLNAIQNEEAYREIKRKFDEKRKSIRRKNSL